MYKHIWLKEIQVTQCFILLKQGIFFKYDDYFIYNTEYCSMSFFFV